MKNKTRKECREETGYEPEDISKIARTHPALLRINTEMNENKNATHEAKVRWVYEGLKAQHQKMLKKNLDEWMLELKSKPELFKDSVVNQALYKEGYINSDELRAIESNHNCTGSSVCFGCEKERRDAYKTGGNYYA